MSCNPPSMYRPTPATVWKPRREKGEGMSALTVAWTKVVAMEVERLGQTGYILKADSTAFADGCMRQKGVIKDDFHAFKKKYLFT